jgi:hypothetical protein
MDIRNAKYNAFGTIDCEIEHPVFSWIPFTANPDDVDPIGADVFNAAQSNAAAYVAPVIDPAEALAAERAAMSCSRLQGRLVLGEATCTALDAIANDDLTPWAMRQTINNAIEWRRTSQAMTELGYLLGYTDAQMDDLFRLAMTVDV